MTNKIKVNELKDKKKTKQTTCQPITRQHRNNNYCCHVAIDQKPPIAASLLHVTQKINNGLTFVITVTIKTAGGDEYFLNEFHNITPH